MSIYIMATRSKPKLETVAESDFLAVNTNTDNGEFFLLKSRDTVPLESVSMEKMLGTVELLIEKELAFEEAYTCPSRNWSEDFDGENGQYMNNCTLCEKSFVGHKRRVVCKKCANMTLKNCPFCGEAAIVTDQLTNPDHPYKQYGCFACEVMFDTAEEWNKRGNHETYE
jgi:hypothetical protein